MGKKKKKRRNFMENPTNENMNRMNMFSVLEYMYDNPDKDITINNNIDVNEVDEPEEEISFSDDLGEALSKEFSHHHKNMKDRIEDDENLSFLEFCDKYTDVDVDYEPHENEETRQDPDYVDRPTLSILIVDDLNKGIIIDGITSTTFLLNGNDGISKYTPDNISRDNNFTKDEFIDIIRMSIEYMLTLRHPEAIFLYDEAIDLFDNITSYDTNKFIFIQTGNYLLGYRIPVDQTDLLMKAFESHSSSIEEFVYNVLMAVIYVESDSMGNCNYNDLSGKYIEILRKNYNHKESFMKAFLQDPETIIIDNDENHTSSIQFTEHMQFVQLINGFIKHVLDTDFLLDIGYIREEDIYDEDDEEFINIPVEDVDIEDILETKPIDNESESVVEELTTEEDLDAMLAEDVGTIPTNTESKEDQNIITVGVDNVSETGKGRILHVTRK